MRIAMERTGNSIYDLSVYKEIKIRSKV